MQRTTSILALLFAAASCLGACDLGAMHPGTSCGSCHTGGDAHAFGAAGTVYAQPNAFLLDGIEGVTVDITAADGHTVSLTSNEAGNFYTTTKLTPPLQVTLSKGGVSAKMANASSGDCNSCHTLGSTPAPGHVYLH